MSNLSSYPMQDGRETTLSQSWDGATGTVYVNSVPTFTFPGSTTTYIVVDPGKSNMQVAKINAYSSANLTLTVSSITVNKGPSLAYTQQTHAVGAKVIISDNYAFWEDIVTSLSTKLDSNIDTTVADTKKLQFGSSSAYISTSNTGTDLLFKDGNNSLTTLSQLTAAAGVDVKVEVSAADTTPGFLDTKLTAGDGISKTITSPGGDERLDLDIDTTDTAVFVKTSSGAGDENKVPVLNASGQLASGFVDIATAINSARTYGGTSADGAVDGTGNITITGSDNTYIYKDYSSWAAGTAPRVLTTTPNNCITHIRIKGDADFSNWTFNYANKGGAATSGNQVAGNPGIALLDVRWFNAGGTNGIANAGGGAGSGSNGSAGDSGGGAGGAKTLMPENLMQYLGHKWISAGGSGATSSTGSSAGGAGGGCLFIEVGGNLTLNNTTTVGTFTGGNGANNGGGGGGGTLVIFYRGTKTGTFTPNVAGGTNGGGGGGAGGSGLSVIEQNITRF